MKRSTCTVRPRWKAFTDGRAMARVAATVVARGRRGTSPEPRAPSSEPAGSLVESRSAAATGATLARGAFFNALAFLASTLRGIFTLLVARLLGSATLGTFVLAWAITDLVSKFATLGLDITTVAFVARTEAAGDRGRQRADHERVARDRDERQRRAGGCRILVCLDDRSAAWTAAGSRARDGGHAARAAGDRALSRQQRALARHDRDAPRHLLARSHRKSRHRCRRS